MYHDENTTSHFVQQNSPQPLDILQVANEDFVVNCCSKKARPKKVYAVQVGNVYSPERVKKKKKEKTLVLC